MKKLSFSGHETFACKIYWLKKGYDFVQSGKRFASDDAVVDLGVGKNMVVSIRFWLKAFGLLDEEAEQPTAFAHFIFGENGVDPYLEDPLTLWLLHYQLIKEERASIYTLLFNRFRRERREFNRIQLKRFLERVCAEEKVTFSPKTIDSDIKVFLSNYVTPDGGELEEAYSNVLQELGLIASSKQLDEDDNLVDVFRFQLSAKRIPIEALLFTILDHPNFGQSISLTQLANDPNAPGNVFLLTETALVDLIKQIPADYAVFSETAGNQVLQLQEGLDKYQILERYYNHVYAEQ